MKSLLCISVFFALSTLAAPAHADFVGAKCITEGATVKVLAKDSSCVGYVDKKGREIRFAAPISGLVLSSADGERVVAIASYPKGNFADGEVRWGQDKNPVVVRVFKGGSEIATHRLTSLVAPEKLRNTISHVSWLAEEPRRFGASIALKTNDGVRYLSTASGAVKRSRPRR